MIYPLKFVALRRFEGGRSFQHSCVYKSARCPRPGPQQHAANTIEYPDKMGHIADLPDVHVRGCHTYKQPSKEQLDRLGRHNFSKSRELLSRDEHESENRIDDSGSTMAGRYGQLASAAYNGRGNKQNKIPNGTDGRFEIRSENGEPIQIEGKMPEGSMHNHATDQVPIRPVPDLISEDAPHFS